MQICVTFCKIMKLGVIHASRIQLSVKVDLEIGEQALYDTDL